MVLEGSSPKAFSLSAGVFILCHCKINSVAVEFNVMNLNRFKTASSFISSADRKRRKRELIIIAAIVVVVALMTYAQNKVQAVIHFAHRGLPLVGAQATAILGGETAPMEVVF